jgi:hypothetical protein
LKTLFLLVESGSVELPWSSSTAKAAAIEAWVDELESSSIVLPMNGGCFREAARMMVGRQEELFYDVMIAATARMHGFTVATRNEKDFRHLGVEIINPFKFH